MRAGSELGLDTKSEGEGGLASSKSCSQCLVPGREGARFQLLEEAGGWVFLLGHS